MKKIVIIGGGIAGLSAGIFAQNCGFESEIYEKHFLPGGLCTSWKRGEYIFDGCIRYVYGSGKGGFCNSIMKKIGACALPYIHHSASVSVDTKAGKNVTFYSNLDTLENHLFEISPADEKSIRALIHAAKQLSGANIPAVGVQNIQDLFSTLQALPKMVPAMSKYGKISLLTFANSLKSEALREAFLKYYGYAELDALPMFYLIMDLAQHHVNNAGWPVGGSLAFARELEKKYLSLGGKIFYRSCVLNILEEKGRAAGIRLTDETDHFCDYLISACDVHSTLNQMLQGRFTPPEYTEAFRHDRIITPILQVSMGIARDISSIPHAIVFPLRKAMKIAGVTYEYLAMRHYSYDPSMAPVGKSSVSVVMETDYDFWARLDRNAYLKEKQTASDKVIARLEDQFPGITQAVEKVDVSTPITTLRYTGNYKGSPQGWQTEVGRMGNYPSKLPGIKNLYLAGQWVQRGGGIPGGAISAYKAVKMICRDSKVKFK